MPVDSRLSSCVALLENSMWNSSVSNTESARNLLSKCIQELNSIKIDTLSANQKSQLRAITSFILQNSTDKQIRLTASRKMLWMCSKLAFSPEKIAWYYPVLHFDDQFSSADLPSSVKEDDLRLPAGHKAIFKPIASNDWTTNGIENLCQDLVDNCSFVSAMLSLAREHAHSLLSLVSPHEDSEFYSVTLHFNGTLRTVSIKNSFPRIENGRNLTIYSTSNPQLLWPTIVEKAYLRVLGGDYDTSGSNLALDIYMLDNRWIPQVDLIKCDASRLLELKGLFHEGKVLLGLGTSRMSDSLARKTGLISLHDYAVEAIDDKIHLRNTWASEDTHRLSISVNELSSFSYIYINWNWTRFFRHCALSVKMFRNPQQTSIHELTQYSLRNVKGHSEEIWMLFECHIPCPDLNATMEVYETDSGQMVLVPDQYICAVKHTSNNRVTLLKLNMFPNANYTMVVHFNQAVNVSVHVYNNISAEFKLEKAQPRFPLRQLIVSEWTPRHLTDGITGPSGGGNWSMPTYIYNPQYDLVVKQNTKVELALYSVPETYVNVDVFHIDSEHLGRSIRLYDATKLVVHRKYNPQLLVHTILLLLGSYKVVVSNYDNIGAPFTMNFFAEADIQMTRVIPSLGVFLRSKVLEWNRTSRIKVYFETQGFSSQITLHVYSSNSNNTSSYRPPIRGSIFDVSTSEGVIINHDWSDSPYGIFIDAAISEPGKYVLLLERFEQGNGSCVVQMGCNNQFEFT